MRGFRTFRDKPGPLIHTVATAGLTLLLLGGCIGSGAADSQQKTSPASLKEFLQLHEKSFRPSDYDPPAADIPAGDRTDLASRETASIVTTTSPESTSGFRVQVIFTKEIVQATELRDSLETLLPQEWVYTVYEAPYYKVRVGNFDDRAAAQVMVKTLVKLGYADAWIVPDHILKKLPPKPPDIFIVPEPRLPSIR